MPKSVYIETTIPSYLTARPSRDLVRAAQQQITREWWEKHRSEYDLRVSQPVIEEAAQGNPEAAERRLACVEGVPLLEVNDAAVELADALIREGRCMRRRRSTRSTSLWRRSMTSTSC